MVVSSFNKLNVRRIVAHVRRNGPQTRATLTKELNVTPATITRLTSELLEHGVLEEIPDPSKKGQKGFPSKLLKLKSESLLTAGVYFDPDTCLPAWLIWKETLFQKNISPSRSAISTPSWKKPVPVFTSN